METVATETGARHPVAVAMARVTSKPLATCSGNPLARLLWKLAGGGVGFRGSGSVSAGGSGTALNTLSSERRTA